MIARIQNAASALRIYLFLFPVFRITTIEAPAPHLSKYDLSEAVVDPLIDPGKGAVGQIEERPPLIRRIGGAIDLAVLDQVGDVAKRGRRRDIGRDA